MTKKEIAEAYIKYLENGNIESVIDLFNENGIVESPIYGIKKASEFYSVLSNDTSSSHLYVKGIFEEKDSNQLALYFTYKWILKNKEEVEFDVVDIIEFDHQNKINKLTIIYDTVSTRQMVEQLNNNE